MENDRRKNKFELRYHHAIPGWCKVIGIPIKEIPLCEGGGYMIEEETAKIIVGHLNEIHGNRLGDK